ncbi:MAG TPA: ACT domain-containing protein [Ktedonobacteraceae bacterium]|nr:ACT domain-containing protein [Ktedonobacteraceae bacterium]
MQKLTLVLLPQKYAVCRLDPNGHIPHWALIGEDFVSLTRTHSELSVVCLEENVPLKGTQAERGWRCLKVEGRFDFSAAGIHVSLAIPLAESSISVLAVATYETDHLLIKEEEVEHAIRVLTQSGHRVSR